MTLKDRRLKDWQHMSYGRYVQRIREWKDPTAPNMWQWWVRVKSNSENIKELWREDTYWLSYEIYRFRTLNEIPLNLPRYTHRITAGKEYLNVKAQYRSNKRGYKSYVSFHHAVRRWEIVLESYKE